MFSKVHFFSSAGDTIMTLHYVLLAILWLFSKSMLFYKKYVQFHISIHLFQYLLISFIQSLVNHSIYTSALPSWRRVLQKLHFLSLYYGYSSVHQPAYGTTGITISVSSLIQQLSLDTGMTGKSWPYVHKQQSIIKKKKNQIQKPEHINPLHS